LIDSLNESNIPNKYSDICLETLSSILLFESSERRS